MLSHEGENGEPPLLNSLVDQGAPSWAELRMRSLLQTTPGLLLKVLVLEG